VTLHNWLCRIYAGGWGSSCPFTGYQEWGCISDVRGWPGRWGRRRPSARCGGRGSSGRGTAQPGKRRVRSRPCTARRSARGRIRRLRPTLMGQTRPAFEPPLVRQGVDANTPPTCADPARCARFRASQRVMTHHAGWYSASHPPPTGRCSGRPAVASPSGAFTRETQCVRFDC
jgi:hypothetical protein